MFVRRGQFEELFFQTVKANVDARAMQHLHDILELTNEAHPKCTLEFLSRPLVNEKFPRGKVLGTLERFDIVADRLARGADPLSDLGNYLVCIEECIDTEGLRCSSGWIRLYLTALHTYCDSIEPSTERPDYLFLMIDSELDAGGTVCADLFADFIEWVSEEVPRSADYDNYYIVLTWLLFRRLRGTTTQAQWDVVMNKLLATNKTVSSVGGNIEPGRWLDLHRRIPLKYGATNEQFETVICGASR